MGEQILYHQLASEAKKNDRSQREKEHCMYLASPQWAFDKCENEDLVDESHPDVIHYLSENIRGKELKPKLPGKTSQPRAPQCRLNPGKAADSRLSSSRLSQITGQSRPLLQKRVETYFRNLGGLLSPTRLSLSGPTEQSHCQTRSVMAECCLGPSSLLCPARVPKAGTVSVRVSVTNWASS